METLLLIPIFSIPIYYLELTTIIIKLTFIFLFAWIFLIIEAKPYEYIYEKYWEKRRRDVLKDYQMFFHNYTILPKELQQMIYSYHNIGFVKSGLHYHVYKDETILVIGSKWLDIPLYNDGFQDIPPWLLLINWCIACYCISLVF